MRVSSFSNNSLVLSLFPLFAYSLHLSTSILLPPIPPLALVLAPSLYLYPSLPLTYFSLIASFDPSLSLSLSPSILPSLYFSLSLSLSLSLYLSLTIDSSCTIVVAFYYPPKVSLLIACHCCTQH